MGTEDLKLYYDILRYHIKLESLEGAPEGSMDQNRTGLLQIIYLIIPVPFIAGGLSENYNVHHLSKHAASPARDGGCPARTAQGFATLVQLNKRIPYFHTKLFLIIIVRTSNTASKMQDFAIAQQAFSRAVFAALSFYQTAEGQRTIKFTKVHFPDQR